MAQGYYGTENNLWSSLTAERIVLTPRTSDPSNPSQGDMWLRADLNSGDKISTLRFEHASGTWSIPVFPTGSSGSAVEEVACVQTPNGLGYIPLVDPTSFDALQQLRFQHDGLTMAFSEHQGAIPDSGDLHARYDFSQYSGSSGFADLSGNGHDLSNGSITGVGATINGIQAGEFGGADDGVWSDTFSTITPPYTIFIVSELGDNPQIDAHNVIVRVSSTDAASWVGYRPENSEVDARDSPGGALTGGTLDDTLITNLRTGDTDSELRTMGTQVDSGTQSADLDVISIGSDQPFASGRNLTGAVGEVLVYPMNKSSIYSDVESYLADKWGISI